MDVLAICGLDLSLLFVLFHLHAHSFSAIGQDNVNAVVTRVRGHLHLPAVILEDRADHFLEDARAGRKPYCPYQEGLKPMWES
jgi:hypothetical protein